VPSLAVLLQALWTARIGDRRAVVAFTGLRPVAKKVKDLALVKQLAEAGSLVPVVDQIFPLERIADAYRHIDRQGKQGTTVVSLS